MRIDQVALGDRQPLPARTLVLRSPAFVYRTSVISAWTNNFTDLIVVDQRSRGGCGSVSRRAG
jgi:hypothetical protein